MRGSNPGRRPVQRRRICDSRARASPPWRRRGRRHRRRGRRGGVAGGGRRVVGAGAVGRRRAQGAAHGQGRGGDAGRRLRLAPPALLLGALPRPHARRGRRHRRRALGRAHGRLRPGQARRARRARAAAAAARRARLPARQPFAALRRRAASPLPACGPCYHPPASRCPSSQEASLHPQASCCIASATRRPASERRPPTPARAAPSS
jgi:hypothetical protein